MRSLKKVPLHEMVADALTQYIKDNQLQEGDKLPSVGELAEMLEVSRTPLREGLRILEAREIIKILNGKGIYVNDAHSIRFEAKIKVENEKKSLLQISEVRRALEGKAVELAAQRANEEELEEMAFHLSEYRRIRDQKGDTSQADLAFHKTIYKAAKNPVLLGVVESVWTTFNHFWSKPFGIETIFEDTYPLHESLLESIKKKDVEQALIEFNLLMDDVEDSIRRVTLTKDGMQIE